MNELETYTSTYVSFIDVGYICIRYRLNGTCTHAMAQFVPIGHRSHYHFESTLTDRSVNFQIKNLQIAFPTGFCFVAFIGNRRTHTTRCNFSRFSKENFILEIFMRINMMEWLCCYESIEIYTIVFIKLIHIGLSLSHPCCDILEVLAFSSKRRFLSSNETSPAPATITNSIFVYKQYIRNSYFSISTTTPPPPSAPLRRCGYGVTLWCKTKS